MKTLFFIFSSVFVFFSYPYCQTNSEVVLKKITQQLKNDIVGTEFSNGIRGRNCFSLGNTIIFQYDVPDSWQAPISIKEDLISNLQKTGAAKTFYSNKINVNYYYFKGNLVEKKVSILSTELEDSNFKLSEFVEIRDHPKAKGVNLKLKLPNNWELKEGDRPNIVKKIVKDGSSYLIQVEELETFYSRKQSIEFLQNDETFSSFFAEYSRVFKNLKTINKSIVTIDSYPAAFYKFRGDIERLGLSFSIIANTWIVLYEDRLVFFQAMTEDSKSYSEVEKIFFLITNSVIFTDQYK
jgi:hypothetical protein